MTSGHLKLPFSLRRCGLLLLPPRELRGPCSVRAPILPHRRARGSVPGLRAPRVPPGSAQDPRTRLPQAPRQLPDPICAHLAPSARPPCTPRGRRSAPAPWRRDRRSPGGAPRPSPSHAPEPRGRCVLPAPPQQTAGSILPSPRWMRTRDNSFHTWGALDIHHAGWSPACTKYQQRWSLAQEVWGPCCLEAEPSAPSPACPQFRAFYLAWNGSNFSLTLQIKDFH